MHEVLFVVLVSFDDFVDEGILVLVVVSIDFETRLSLYLIQTFTTIKRQIATRKLFVVVLDNFIALNDL